MVSQTCNFFVHPPVPVGGHLSSPSTNHLSIVVARFRTCLAVAAFCRFLRTPLLFLSFCVYKNYQKFLIPSLFCTHLPLCYIHWNASGCILVFETYIKVHFHQSEKRKIHRRECDQKVALIAEHCILLFNVVLPPPLPRLPGAQHVQSKTLTTGTTGCGFLSKLLLPPQLP